MQLTKQQLKAAHALVSGMTQGKAAVEAGVTRQTIIRWSKLPEFQQKLAELNKTEEAVQAEVFIQTSKERATEILSPQDLKVRLSEWIGDNDLKMSDRIRSVELLSRLHGLSGSTTSDVEICLNAFPGRNVDLSAVEQFSDAELDKLSPEEFAALYEKTKQEALASLE